MSVKGKSTKSLLDSGSEVTLMNESYFKEHIEHRLLPSSGAYNNSHNLFSLCGMEEGNVPLSKHFKCDIEVGGANHTSHWHFSQKRQGSISQFKGKES